MKFFFSLLFTLIILFVHAQEHPEIPNREDLVNIAREIIAESEYCSLVTKDHSGAISARIMQPFPVEDDFSVYLGTNTQSRKIRQIEADNGCTLFYFDHSNFAYVSLIGNCFVKTEKELIEKYWRKDWEDFYPNYPEGYSLIYFEPESIEVLSPNHGIVGDE